MVTEITAQPDAPPVEAVVESPPVAPAAVVEATPPVAPAPAVESAAPPAAAVVPPTPVATAPAVAPEVQEYIKRLEQQNQTAQAQEDARILQEAVTQYAQLLEREQGLTPEQAKYIADREGTRLHQQYQAEQFRQGQQNAAFDTAKKHGADPKTLMMLQALMNLPTPDAMEAAAQAATGQSKLAAELAAAKAEIERLKKASVPPQTFASGAVGGDGGKPTKDNIDGLYLKDPERYGATYRKFLATGEIS